MRFCNQRTIQSCQNCKIQIHDSFYFAFLPLQWQLTTGNYRKKSQQFSEVDLDSAGVIHHQESVKLHAEVK